MRVRSLHLTIAKVGQKPHYAHFVGKFTAELADGTKVGTGAKEFLFEFDDSNDDGVPGEVVQSFLTNGFKQFLSAVQDSEKEKR